MKKFLQYHLSKIKNNEKLKVLSPLIEGIDNFFFEPSLETGSCGPHIRDAIDLKRWMVLVVMALMPVTFMAIWNSGMQSFVYSGGDGVVVKEFLMASKSFSGYFSFAFSDGRYLKIIFLGLKIFLPVVVISYSVGGFWEVLFACIRRHPVAEGFLVTGILYALILPPTIPYWMVAVGITFGVVFGKEVFGGTGMNIVNPAIVSRCFLFFAFPGRMSGDVWVGSNIRDMGDSIASICDQKCVADGFSTATPLSVMNVGSEIKTIHVDTIAASRGAIPGDFIENQFSTWNANFGEVGNSLSTGNVKDFLSTAMEDGGVGLSSEFFDSAYDFASLKYGLDNFTDWNHFFGNQWGSFGETSTFACILGGGFLLLRGIISWHIVGSSIVGVIFTASALQLFGGIFSPGGWEWMDAKFSFPIYKHFLVGSLAFGITFMATDPVSSPDRNLAKIFYGLFIGFLIVIIRLMNPAYPEGVMLAILLGNVFAPLLDRIALRIQMRRNR